MYPKLLLLTVLYLSSAIAYDKGVTISVGPGKKECFYQGINASEIIGIVYQVIDGGDLDITFTLVDPYGMGIITDIQRSENKHKYEAPLTGDYGICFNNKFGTFTAKIVYFNLIVEREGVQNLGDEQWNELPEGLKPEEYYEIKVKDIISYIDRIRAYATKAQHIQETISSFEKRDRNLAEKNFTKVNVWSAFQTIVMILVGLLQVYMLRSIFETGTTMNRLLRKIKF